MTRIVRAFGTCLLLVVAVSVAGCGAEPAGTTAINVQGGGAAVDATDATAGQDAAAQDVATQDVAAEPDVAADSSGADDTAAPQDAAAADDTAAPQDTAAPSDTVAAPDTTPAQDTSPEPDTTPAQDTSPEPDTTPAQDTSPEPDTTPAPDTSPEPDTTPTSKGKCDNASDVAALAKVDPNKAIGGCVSKCFIAGPTCNACLKSGLGVSDGCTGCFASIVDCTVKNCALQCIQPTSKGCSDCQQAKCFPAFVACSGVSPP